MTDSERFLADFGIEVAKLIGCGTYYLAPGGLCTRFVILSGDSRSALAIKGNDLAVVISFKGNYSPLRQFPMSDPDFCPRHIADVILQESRNE